MTAVVFSSNAFGVKGSNGWERNTSYRKRINCRFWSSSQQCHLQQFVIQFIVTFLHFEILYFRAPDFEGLDNVVVEFRVFDGKSAATATVLYVVSDNGKFDFLAFFLSIVLIDFNVAPIITFMPDSLDYTEGHPSIFFNGSVTITDVNDLNMTG